MSGHGQARQQGHDETPGQEADPQEVARGVDTDAGDASQQDTPPGGDVRTVYANDRDPGEAEPASPR